MKIVLTAVIVVIICCVAFGAYIVYTDMQEQNEELNQSLQQVQQQLNDTQQNNTTNDSQTSDSSQSSSSSSESSSGSKASSSSNKVTYEQAGVDKNVGYMKTCKYPGCGAVYDSRLEYCPKCGHRNIYV